MGDVIPIAHICQVNLGKIAEMLLQRKEIGERLTRMLKVAECIDYRDISVCGHIFDRRVTESAQHDQVNPALQVVGDVMQRLAGVDAAAGLVHEESGSAQAIHAGLEGQASAE